MRGQIAVLSATCRAVSTSHRDRHARLLATHRASRPACRNPRLGPGFEAERLSRVLVTHLHGDHCFGLPGMLTLADEARRGTAHEGRPIHVVGPPGVADLVHLGIG